MDTTNEKRHLPNGIQSFERIRTENYLYADKTDMVWEIANGDVFNYLSRPRRFGKSLLVNTLQCYFEGRKELFEGLKIMQLEKSWQCHPVIHLDMSSAGASRKEIESYLDFVFHQYEDKYGITELYGNTPAVRFMNIIQTACNVTGQRVVVLVDEYDSPLQHSWNTPEHNGCTDIYRNVFAVLKSCERYERFVFITGITKFTQVSLFSVLNNLTNLSFKPQYAAVCGLTKNDLNEVFSDEIQLMADGNSISYNAQVQQLTEHYDGYHFCRKGMLDIYNPYSVISALSNGEIGNYWAASGATVLIRKFVKDIEMKIDSFDNSYIDKDTMELSDVTGGGAELFLYQSGYLTIKDFDDFGYYLSFPNEEVRNALYRMVLPALTMKSEGDVVSVQAKLFRQFNNADIDGAMLSLKQLVADVPYSNKKLNSIDMEERYRLIISNILHAIGMHVEVEHQTCVGRIDILAKNLNYIFVIELKLSKNGGLSAAAQQIKDRRYADAFVAERQKTISLAIELDDMGRGIVDYSIL